MPSNFPDALKTLIANGWVRSHPAIDITLTDGTILHYSNLNLIVGDTTYVDRLSKVGALKLSLLAPADRCEIEIENVDGVPGEAIIVPTSSLTKATAVMYRIYVSLADNTVVFKIPRLAGLLQSDAKKGDKFITAILVSDVNAVGELANYEVQSTCMFRYKDPNSCTYAGDLPTCDLTLTGGNGCIVHQGNDSAYSHFGGNALFLDEQTIAQFGSSLGPGGGGPLDPNHGRLIDGLDGWGIDGPIGWRFQF